MAFKINRKKVLRFFWKLFVFTIVWVILLKWIPVVVTPLMVIRYVQAKVEDRPAQIDYDWVANDEISDNLKRAVVASEDQRFYNHFGFDWEAIKGAIEHNKDGKKMRGGSTISQQTAKNVFLWNGRNFIRKGLEAYFTIWIELIWGKKRILHVYLNVIEMGDGIYGAEAAAQHYFKKSAKDLNETEAATIAAILPSPIRYSKNLGGSYVQSRVKKIKRQMRNLQGTLPTN